MKFNLKFNTFFFYFLFISLIKYYSPSYSPVVVDCLEVISNTYNTGTHASSHLFVCQLVATPNDQVWCACLRITFLENDLSTYI